MFNLPVTFYFDFETFNAITSEQRMFFMREFSSNGAKHLVLSDWLMKQVLTQPKLEKSLLKEMKSTGLSFLDAHAPYHPYLDLSCPLPEYAASIVERHKLNLNICDAMGVKTITMHVGNDHWLSERYPIEVYIDCAKRSLEGILPLAEQLGITICIENVWFATNTPEVLNTIKQFFPSDSLGFCYDAGHANLMDKGRTYTDSMPKQDWQKAGRGEPIWEDHALEKMLPNIVNCHLHDNYGNEDSHRNIGHGNIDWQHIIPLLKSAPRLQCIQSEVIIAQSGESICEVVKAFEQLGVI